MYNNKLLIHPKKLVREMNKFVNAASTLEYYTYNFDLGKLEATKCFVKMVGGGDFAVRKAGEFGSRIEIRHPFTTETEEEYKSIDILFRRDFVNRCRLAQGFADVTLSLLHELGHMHSEQPQDDEEYELMCWSNMLNSKTLEEVNLKHFAMPNEVNATDWAIEWLQDPEHRKLAKAFEKEFFKCFE